MKQRILLFITMLFFLSFQTTGQNSKISLETKRLIKEYKKLEKVQDKYEIQLEKILNDFPLEKSGNDFMIGVIIKVSQDIQEDAVKKLGATINTKAGNIWTLRLPVKSIPKLEEIQGIEYIQADTKIKKKLDNARQETSVNQVHTGAGLSQAYLGTGVIVGVIDFGFDYTHPTFWDLQGQNLRLSRAWNMTDNSGFPPSPFTYGSEIIGAQALFAAMYSATDGSHGTHVAGIAGGSGYATEGYFTGVAPNSELVFVQLGGGQSAVIDAVSYIFSYAQSVGKPAVINMSLGTHIGPHDGTSVQDQAFNSLTGAGKILVGAAGNEGGTPMHASQVFPLQGGQNNPEVIVYFEESQANTGSGLVEIWGMPNTSITLAVNVLDLIGNYIDYTDYLQSANEPEISVNLSGVLVEAMGEASSITNNRPHFLVYIENTNSNFVTTIELKDDYGTANTIHIWNHGHGHGAPLTNNFPGIGVINGWMNGNTDYTVGEIGGTASGVITAGAYTTKNSYVNLNGQTQVIPFYTDLGAIAPFSSHGPTLDGRVKPDISSPGNVIISSVNSYDANYGPSNPEVAVQLTDGSHYWYFASMQGTSMASPFTAGVTALMLEARPTLNPHNIRTLFYQTSRSDGFTGTIPFGGSNIWGSGKIQAYNAVVLAVNFNGTNDIAQENPMLVYPNPAKDFTTVTLPPYWKDPSYVEIIDSKGQIINVFFTESELLQINLVDCQPGLYLLRASSGGKTVYSKVMVQ